MRLISLSLFHVCCIAPLQQEKTGAHLTTLESRWSDLVTSTVQLEMANKALEGEVRMLRRKEEGLRREMEEREGGAQGMEE